MTAVLVVAIALSILVGVLKGPGIFSVRGGESEFDPGSDKSIRDLLE